ncbi:MAG: hypothetical protein C0525_02645 [Flavobacterium sp.]|nr:hypothetical protein [Flavobacterium sp.]
MNVFLRSILIISILFFGSCQKEEETVVQDTTQSFERSAPIAGLLIRTSQNPTSLDNVLDSSSCFSVQLPVTVIVNGNQITVADESDYQLVQDAIDAYSNDDDLVNFVYPITIRFQNFQTQVLTDADALDDVLDSCGDDDGFDEIDCISLVYPIQINIYDSNNQVANTVTITSNSGLFNFLNNLSSNTYVAINYPISAVDSYGQTVTINSNSELENFIDEAIDDCDDDNSGGSGSDTLTSILTSGSWFIQYCYYDEEDETYHYEGFDFDFNANETVTAVRNNQTIDGDWDLQTEATYQKLDLHFDGSELEYIETGWKVIEFNTTIIRLKKQHSDRTDYLTFKKN